MTLKLVRPSAGWLARHEAIERRSQLDPTLRTRVGDRDAPVLECGLRHGNAPSCMVDSTPLTRWNDLSPQIDLNDPTTWRAPVDGEPERRTDQHGYRSGALRPGWTVVQPDLTVDVAMIGESTDGGPGSATARRRDCGVLDSGAGRRARVVGIDPRFTRATTAARS